MMKKEIGGKVTVVATRWLGLFDLLRYGPGVNYIDKNLTLEGLRIIYDKNTADK